MRGLTERGLGAAVGRKGAGPVVLGMSLAAGFAVALAAGGERAAAQQTTAAQTVPANIVLAPHRAVYEFTLDQTRGGTGVTDLTGRMVYELTGSTCDGYTQNMRFVTRMSTQDGNATVSDMRSSSWEDGIAKLFRFTSSQYKDAKLSESAQGDAARSGVGGEVIVDMTKPAKKEIKVKRDVYFPIQHSIALLAAAKKGDTVFQADLYDGSEKGEKYYATTAYIGRPQPKGYNKSLPAVAAASQAAAAKLDDMMSWPVSISYFDPAKEKLDGIPSYELAFLYFENGVSRRLFIDYGDFAMRGTLKEVSFLEPSKCDPKKP
ncbi:MAG: cell envelope integrity EipB family protein [Hyphomicrobiaceae bacterium]